MSGEITVTPGKTFTSSEDLDYSKLNQLGQPTASLDADAVTSTEIDSAEFTAAFADSFRGTNYFFNPVFWRRYWEETDADGKVCPDGELTENAAGWFVLPTGADVEYRREESIPSASQRNEYAVKIVGETSCTLVKFGQYITGDVAKQLEAGSVTVSFYVKIAGAGSSSMVVRASVSSTAGDASTIVSAASETAGANVAPGDGWVKREATLDFSAIADLEKGVAITIESSNCQSDSQTISFTQMQLEPTTAATTFINPDNPNQGTYHNLHASAAPTATDDITLGYRPGSLHVDKTTASDPEISVATATDEGAAIWHRIDREDPVYIWAYETQTDGTDAGTFTSGAHVVRALTNLTTTSAGIGSLATNQITLPAGTYAIDGSVPCYRTNESAAWLYDTTGSAVLVNGTSCDANSSGGSGDHSYLRGTFVLSAESVLEVRFEGTTTRATDGLGHAASLSRSGGEVYTSVLITKIPVA